MNIRAIEIHSHVEHKKYMVCDMYTILHSNSPLRRGFYFPSTETNSEGS